MEIFSFRLENTAFLLLFVEKQTEVAKCVLCLIERDREKESERASSEVNILLESV